MIGQEHNTLLLASGATSRSYPWRAPGLVLPLAFVLLLMAALFAPQWFTALAPDAIAVDNVLRRPDLDHWFAA